MDTEGLGIMLTVDDDLALELFKPYECNPRFLQPIAQALARLISPRVEALVAMDEPGIILATAISLSSRVPAAYLRPTLKDHGLVQPVEGAAITNTRVCLVEKIVSSQGIITNHLATLRHIGAVPVQALCLLLTTRAMVDSQPGLRVDVSAIFTCQ